MAAAEPPRMPPADRPPEIPPERNADPPPNEARPTPRRDAGVDRAGGAIDDRPGKLRPLIDAPGLMPRGTPERNPLPEADADVRAKLLAPPRNAAELPRNEFALPRNALELPWEATELPRKLLPL
jgi:hypothetical protein